MEENENKDAVVNDEQSKKDEIKEETVKTAQEVKEAIKNVNIKNDAKATTGFIKEMFKNPLGRLKDIAEDNSHKDFKFAVVLAIIWMIVSGLVYIGSYYSIDSFFRYDFGGHLLSLIKAIIAPALGIIVLAAIVFIVNKNNKKSFVTVLTSITAAKIPTILASILGLLRFISLETSKIINPVAAFARVITIVFTFFGVKALFGEEDNSKFLKSFIIIEAIYYVAYFVISFLGISI